jgi:hypothetical protein
MVVLGAVGDHQEDPRGRQALDQAIQERLGLRVDPVEVLYDQEQGLHLTLPAQESLDSVQRALAALGRIEGLPLRVLNRAVQGRKQAW